MNLRHFIIALCCLLPLKASASSTWGGDVFTSGLQTNGAVLYFLGSYSGDSTNRAPMQMVMPKATAVGPMYCTATPGAGGSAQYRFRVIKSTDQGTNWSNLDNDVTCVTAVSTGKSCSYTGTPGNLNPGDSIVFEAICTGTGSCSSSGVTFSCGVKLE